MTDKWLDSVLQAADDAAPDPIEFKRALRSDLDATLQRNVMATERNRDTVSSRRSDQVGNATHDTTTTVPIPRGESRSRRNRVLLAAVMVALTVTTFGVERATRTPHVPDTEVVPSERPLPVPPTTITPSISTACETYVASATPIGELEKFTLGDIAVGSGAQTSAPGARSEGGAPDLGATAAALSQLAETLTDHGLIDPMPAGELLRAAGAMRQASIELAGEDSSAARQSVRSALAELRDLTDEPDPTQLDGCKFP